MARGWLQGQRTDDGELDGHEDPEEMEEDLQWRPLFGTKKTPCARGENEGVPGGDGEGAHEEVLVCREVRGKIEVGREDLGEVGDASVGSVCRVVGHACGLPENRRGSGRRTRAEEKEIISTGRGRGSSDGQRR